MACTPRQNGVTVRKNRTLLEIVNVMLVDSNLNNSFLVETMLTTCYILNRISLKKAKVSLYELWKKIKLNLSHLKVWDWDCRAIVRLPKPKIKKLGQKAINYIFLGCAHHNVGYRFLLMELNNSVDVNIVDESKDTEFLENRFNANPL